MSQPYCCGLALLRQSLGRTNARFHKRRREVISTLLEYRDLERQTRAGRAGLRAVGRWVGA